MNPIRSGICASVEPISTRRRPTRSTIRPPTSVPHAPAISIAASAVLPPASLSPYWVISHTGANVWRP